MDSIAARYYVVLEDQNGVQQAIFDNFKRLHFERRVNDVGNYSLDFYDDGDTRFDLFTLDSRIKVFRSVPYAGLAWYTEFRGLHRNPIFEVADSGERYFSSIGFDYNDLLQRSIVAYKAGTIRADKNDRAEKVMKEYVEENCGPTADDTVVGRLYQGGFPNFTVEPIVGYGDVWTGSRAYENLIDVLRDIAGLSNVDFNVEENGNGFIFRTFKDQMGANRTTEGIEKNTNVNIYGNSPVVFSLNNGNIATIRYEYDRAKEANVCVVTGSGDGSTRTTITVQDSSLIDDSLYNRREVSRSAGSYDEDFETFSLTTQGNETLKELSPKYLIEFTPLQQPSTLYGLNYFLGDKITVEFRGVQYVKKVVGVTIDVEENKETIGIEFSDITY